MDAISLYVIKMITCSAVLYGYYRLALYNEKFHQWNRFYLLAAMGLSTILPFISIPVISEPASGSVLNLINGLPWNAGAINQASVVNWQQIIWITCLVVSVFLLIKTIAGIITIAKAYRKSAATTKLQHNVTFILTTLHEAPFSFFNWLFWRNDIDLASENGSRILAHELAHIQQGHSIDKLFTSVVLAVFWLNPFFWLMRKELYTIHEFLADSKAIEQNNSEAFAKMILQALPTNTRFNSLLNPFFSSQIKRRLFMITTSNNSKYSYMRRLSGLVLMAGSALLLTLSVQQSNAQTVISKKEKKVEKEIKETASPKKEKKVITGKFQKNTTTNDKVNSIKIEEINNIKSIKGTGKIQTHSDADLLNPGTDNPPLYIVDGKEVKAVDIKSINPSTIKTVDVLKGKKATSVYGTKGSNGVVIIKTGKPEAGEQQQSKVTVRSNSNQPTPVYYKDGKEITTEEMNTIKPTDIQAVNVLKGESATTKYGEKGKNGVIEIVMKKPAV